MSTQRREFRYLLARELRVSNDNGMRVLSGYAAVFNSLSEDLGMFREQIRPGAFTRCLNGSPDVVCLREHDPRLGVLGRTTSGTLRLSEDSIGLRFEADLPSTSFASDLEESINRGDINGCSFGFIGMEDDWSRSTDGSVVRTLLDVDVFDVSVVTFPAYTATSVQMRSLMFPEGAPRVQGIHASDESEQSTLLAAICKRRLKFAA